MNKYYLAEARKGRLKGLKVKIVEDVRVPVSDKLHQLGQMSDDFIVKQRVVARFINEDEAREWLKAYNTMNDLKRYWNEKTS